MLADELGVPVDDLLGAANASVYQGEHSSCPSANLALVWLAKPFFVLKTMGECPHV